MHTRLFFSLITVCLLSLGFATKAQAEGLPKYQVELIVFETLALRGWTEEYWHEPDLINTDGAVNLTTLPANRFMLQSEANKMTPKKGYHILYHTSWVLEGKPEDQTKPVLIEALPEKSYQSKLLGTIVFYKSRYAHVRLDLELERKIPLRIRDEFAANENLEEVDLPDFWRFQLKESRKIKSGELHYFDHPIFGALVKIQYLGR